MFEWRKIAALTKFEFLLEITGEIVMPRKLDRRTERRVGLHENFAGRFAAAGASGDLREQLERAFAGAEIGQVQREIGVDDSDERHIRKMQTFRDHLRADEDVDLAGAESRAEFRDRRLCASSNRHPSGARRLWEKFATTVDFDFLRAEPGINQCILAAGRTFFRHGGGVPAQMAAQPRATRAMKGERDAAVRTIARFAAIAAQERGGETAAIEEQNGLFVVSRADRQSRLAIFRRRWLPTFSFRRSCRRSTMRISGIWHSSTR